MKDNKFLIFFYDERKTSVEEVGNFAKEMEKVTNTTPYIFLPKHWDYEYMSKEEALVRLDAIKYYVEHYYE